MAGEREEFYYRYPDVGRDPCRFPYLPLNTTKKDRDLQNPVPVF
jgi:hypothetical protein